MSKSKGRAPGAANWPAAGTLIKSSTSAPPRQLPLGPAAAASTGQRSPRLQLPAHTPLAQPPAGLPHLPPALLQQLNAQLALQQQLEQQQLAQRQQQLQQHRSLAAMGEQRSWPGMGVHAPLHLQAVAQAAEQLPLSWLRQALAGGSGATASSAEYSVTAAAAVAATAALQDAKPRSHSSPELAVFLAAAAAAQAANGGDAGRPFAPVAKRARLGVGVPLQPQAHRAAAAADEALPASAFDGSGWRFGGSGGDRSGLMAAAEAEAMSARAAALASLAPAAGPQPTLEAVQAAFRLLAGNGGGAAPAPNALAAGGDRDKSLLTAAAPRAYDRLQG